MRVVFVHCSLFYHEIPLFLLSVCAWCQQKVLGVFIFSLPLSHCLSRLESRFPECLSPSSELSSKSSSISAHRLLSKDLWKYLSVCLLIFLNRCSASSFQKKLFSSTFLTQLLFFNSLRAQFSEIVGSDHKTNFHTHRNFVITFRLIVCFPLIFFFSSLLSLPFSLSLSLSLFLLVFQFCHSSKPSFANLRPFFTCPNQTQWFLSLSFKTIATLTCMSSIDSAAVDRLLFFDFFFKMKIIILF